MVTQNILLYIFSVRVASYQSIEFLLQILTQLLVRAGFSFLIDSDYRRYILSTKSTLRGGNRIRETDRKQQRGLDYRAKLYFYFLTSILFRVVL